MILILNILLVTFLFSEAFAWSISINRHAVWLRSHTTCADTLALSYNIIRIHVLLTTSLSLITWIWFCLTCSKVHLHLLSLHSGTYMCVFTVLLIQLAICHSYIIVARCSCLPHHLWPIITQYVVTYFNVYTYTSTVDTHCARLRVWHDSCSTHKQHKSLLVSFLDILPDMVWTKDIHNKFMYVNKRIQDDLLLTPISGDPIGRTSVDIAECIRTNSDKSYTFGEVCNDSDDIVKRTETSQRFLEYGNVDGSFLALRVIKAPIYKNNTLIGTIGIGRDVTWDWQDHAALEKLLADKQYDEALALLRVHMRRDIVPTL